VLPLSESIFYLICQKFLLGAPYFILFIIVSDVNYITQYFLSSDILVSPRFRQTIFGIIYILYKIPYFNRAAVHAKTNIASKNLHFSLFYPKLRVATGQIFITTSIRSCLAACNKKCHRQSLFLRLAGRLLTSPVFS
jgi:hypothetical protein